MFSVPRIEFSKTQWAISSPEENLYTQSWGEILQQWYVLVVATVLSSRGASPTMQTVSLQACPQAGKCP